MSDRKFYITTAISYPNGPPHIGHAYEDVGDRRARPLPAARRRRRLLPHRHRRARPQDAADGGASRASAARDFADRNASLFQKMATALDCSNDDFIRTTEPRHYRSCEEIWRRMADGGRHLQGQLCRLVLGPRRGLLRRGRDRGEAGQCPLRAAGHAGRMGGGGELLLPALRLSGPAARPLRGESRLHRSRRAAQRGRELRQGRAQGPLDLAHDLRLGHSGAGATRATSCMSGSTRSPTTSPASASPTTGDVRPLLAGRSPRHRQGHRALPRGLLAGLPDVGRARAAEARLRPRLPLQPRREDVEVGRQRRRSRSRLSTPLASTRSAISSCARCRSARTATTATRRSSSASTPISPTISATSRSARCR